MPADITIEYSGPVFDHEAQAILDRGVEHVRQNVAAEGKRRVIAAFASMIRVNQGRFLSRIGVSRGSVTVTTPSGHNVYSMVITADPSTDDVVYADQAAYGPWLEGTGSRNETTRFKGYHGFRIAGQELDRDAGRIAAETLAPYVAEMNA